MKQKKIITGEREHCPQPQLLFILFHILCTTFNKKLSDIKKVIIAWKLKEKNRQKKKLNLSDAKFKTALTHTVNIKIKRENLTSKNDFLKSNRNSETGKHSFNQLIIEVMTKR